MIDPARYYKNKNQILDEMNESKQTSPIILIDPVQKERNACAALSIETLKKFIMTCKEFILDPKEEFFFKKDFDLNEFKNLSKKHGAEFIILKVKSSKNKADIAGAKLKKFYEFLLYNLKKNNFTMINCHFDFDEKTLNSKYFFVVKEPPKEILIQGPPLNVAEKYKTAFRKKWPKAFTKHNKLMALTSRKFSSFEQLLKSIFKDQIKDMAIKNIEIA